MATTNPKSHFELTVELVKALAWPVIAIILLIVFWTPLHQSANQLPSIIGRSDSITIAGLSIKIGASLKAKATPDVEKVLSQLSASGVERLLAMGASSMWEGRAATNGREVNSEVIALGLAVEIPKNELEQSSATSNRNFQYGVRITDLGIRTQGFLKSVIAEFIQQLTQQPREPAK